jgi:hypothetical protein
MSSAEQEKANFRLKFSLESIKSKFSPDEENVDPRDGEIEAVSGVGKSGKI